MNPIKDYYFDLFNDLRKMSNDDLETEWIVSRRLADKRGLPSDYRDLEMVEDEIRFRNRNNNSTWRPERFEKV